MVDALLHVATDQAITASAAGDEGAIDLKQAEVYGFIGEGTPKSLRVRVGETGFGGTGTITFHLVTDTAEPLDDSSVVLSSSAAFAVADLVAGKLVVVPIPEDAQPSRYMGIWVECSATPSGGSINAWFEAM